MTGVCRVTASYASMYAVNVGKDYIRRNQLFPGRYEWRCVSGKDGNGSITYLKGKGTLNSNGAFTGLGKFYALFGLAVGDDVKFEFQNGEIDLSASRNDVEINPQTAQQDAFHTTPIQPRDTALRRYSANHVSLDDFELVNYAKWVPQTEASLYMVFGKIEEYLKVKYVCGCSREVQRRLGVGFPSAPDAIVVEKATGQYLVAEFKMYSSAFVTGNQTRDFVDILICWEDDCAEADKAKLPNEILCLKSSIAEFISNGTIEIGVG